MVYVMNNKYITEFERLEKLEGRIYSYSYNDRLEINRGIEEYIVRYDKLQKDVAKEILDELKNKYKYSKVEKALYELCLSIVLSK